MSKKKKKRVPIPPPPFQLGQRVEVRSLCIDGRSMEVDITRGIIVGRTWTDYEDLELGRGWTFHLRFSDREKPYTDSVHESEISRVLED